MTTSCVEEYWPDLDSLNTRALVVNGKISNLSGPYTVKLSYSSSVLDTLLIPISSAIVTILDNQGNNETLTEQYPGVYITGVNGIQGIIGHSYKINIQLQTGEIYESNYEKLLNPIGIEKISFEKEWRYAQNELETNQEGLQFYADFNPTNLSKAYFFWEIEETYEYHSSYRMYFMYNGKDNNNAFFENLAVRELSNIDTLYYCWKMQNLDEMLSYGLESVDLIGAKDLPLHFIPLTDERLRWGYNISVKQYTVSEQAYTFLKDLKKQRENQGNLFSTQPFQIRGNVFNIHNSSEPVLGYFMVASGVSAPRIQTRAQGGLLYDVPVCYWDSAVSSVKHRIENYREGDYPLFFSYFRFSDELDDPLLGPLVFTYIGPNCIDCRKHGGITTKPEFWEW